MLVMGDTGNSAYRYATDIFGISNRIQNESTELYETIFIQK